MTSGIALFQAIATLKVKDSVIDKGATHLRFCPRRTVYVVECTTNTDSMDAKTHGVQKYKVRSSRK